MYLIFCNAQTACKCDSFALCKTVITCAIYCMQLLVGLSVCLSVCQSVTVVSPAKMAEPVEMPLGLRARMGLRNHVLGGDQDLPWVGAILRGRGG